MRRLIVVIVAAAFTPGVYAGAYDAIDRAEQADPGFRLTWRVTFGGAPSATPKPRFALAQRETRTQLPPPPTSEPSTTGEVTTVPMDPPPPMPEDPSYFSRITGLQWVGIGVAVIALGAVIAGGGGGGDAPEPQPPGSGGG